MRGSPSSGLDSPSHTIATPDEFSMKMGAIEERVSHIVETHKETKEELKELAQQQKELDFSCRKNADDIKALHDKLSGYWKTISVIAAVIAFAVSTFPTWEEFFKK